MKKLLIVITFITLISTIYPAQEIDKIAAVVGREIILESDVQDMLNQLMMQQNKQFSPEELVTYRNQILQRLIDNKVLFYQAVKDSIEVTRQEIEPQIEQRIEELIQMFGNKAKLIQALQQEGMTLRDLKVQYLEEYKAQLITQKIMMEKTKNISISASEVKNFFENYKDSIPTQEETFKLTYIFLEAEDKFPMMVRQYSDHIQTVNQGGELGWFKKGELMKELDSIAFELPLFEVSNPIETPLGLHLIQVCGKDEKQARIKVRHILKNSIRDDKKDAIEQLNNIKKDLDMNTKLLVKKYNTMDSLLKLIEEDKDFETLVKENSEDISAKEKGNNIGWRTLSDFRTLFPEDFSEIKNLRQGEISHILQTSEGFFVLKILEYTPKRKLSLETDWSIIERHALEYKKNQYFRKWLDKISKHYYIEIKE